MGFESDMRRLVAIGLLLVSVGDSAPQEENQNELADAVEKREVVFSILQQSNEVDGGQIKIPISVHNSSEFLLSHFQKKYPTCFSVHGWLGSDESVPVKVISSKYIQTREEGNIVEVDWSVDASWKVYPIAAMQVQTIGQIIADLIDKLIEIGAIDPKTTHLIGHSLGAHVMGNAGSLVKNGRIGRITGLDPAKPGFEGIAYDSFRLDQTDAEFVDIIHSAAGVAGYYGVLGHADFYPNGGSPPQPGCLTFSEPSKLASGFNVKTCGVVGCSHGRSYEFYAESILNPHAFQAVECDSWANFTKGLCDNNKVAFMGESTDPTGNEDAPIPISHKNSSQYLNEILIKQVETKVIVHGWQCSLNCFSVKNTINEYLMYRAGNLIAVDWSEVASEPYTSASAKIGEVASEFKELLAKLYFSEAVDLSRLHLIGHSLGAHICGVAGSMLPRQKVARITGLDPTHLNSDDSHVSINTLDKSDANFVDVIHTSGSDFKEMGHVQFFPNGGSDQPGCSQLSCSHARSYEYFGESINHRTNFNATQCSSWTDFVNGNCDNNTHVYMGDSTPSKARGLHFLFTNDKPEYGKR